MQLEEYLERDDRIVLPVGSTEQHAYLSLETDNVLAERIAFEAAEPLGKHVVRAEREVRVLLGRAERQDDPVVSPEVLLELHPVEVVDPHLGGES